MPRKAKTENEEEDILEPQLRDAWDLKRILIGFIVLAVVLYFLLTSLQSITSMIVNKSSQVLSAQSERIDPEDVKLPDSADVSRTLEKVKQDLEKMTADNISSSQSAIAEIIRELQKLQAGDQSARDLICQTFCTDNN